MRCVIDQIGWKYGWGKVNGPGEALLFSELEVVL
jgi:hypothetical protein